MNLEYYIKKLTRQYRKYMTKKSKTIKPIKNTNKKYITHMFIEGGMTRTGLESFIPKFQINSFDFKPGDMVTIEINQLRID